MFDWSYGEKKKIMDLHLQFHGPEEHFIACSNADFWLFFFLNKHRLYLYVCIYKNVYQLYKKKKYYISIFVYCELD